jgi:acetyl-CoA acyltransferase
MLRDAVIAGYVRTPFTFARKGPLAQVRPDDLGGGMALEAV